MEYISKKVAAYGQFVLVFIATRYVKMLEHLSLDFCCCISLSQRRCKLCNS